MMTDERIFMEYSYEMFLVEEAINRANIFNYLDAHVALESGDLSAISYVCESAIDSIKNGIAKIIDAAKRLWNKFLERVGELFTTDKAYLERYKDIINKHPFKDHELTDYYEYDIDGISSKFTIPNIDTGFDKLIGIENVDDVKKNFMEEHLPSLNSSNEIKDEIEEALTGESKTIKMDTLNKANIFNYCANYDKVTLANLKKELVKLDNIKNMANDKISKALKGIEDIEKEREADKENLKNRTADPKDSNNMDDKYNTSLKNLQADIGKEANDVNKDKKDLKESFNFVNEVGVGKAGDSGSSSGSTTSSNLDSTEKAKIASATSKYIPSSAKEENLTKAKDNYKRIQSNSTEFFTCCGNILAGKMTVALAAYKQSMQILRTHVRDYVADEAAPNANANKK